MKEVFEKIKERLEEKIFKAELHDFGWEGQTVNNLLCLGDAIEIVNQVAEEYSNSEIPNMSDGWIPCSSGELPDSNVEVNITWVNRKPPSYYADIKDKPFTSSGHYHNGRWYWHSWVCKEFLDEYGDSFGDRVDRDIEIIAWQPLPAPYKPKGEK